VALDEYKRKRNFAKTTEPGPELESHAGQRFVVQKHRASRLHYDFRLEMDGVLKSWAVPKGPSLDPADKRLAMMVEDHPVSYVNFEGIIPAGNYGAGTVMVWDIGTWTPLDDAQEMLKKGDLKFELHGEKLKGSFVLAHMKSRRPGSKGTEWLLIKHRDDAVVEGYDIDKYDYSVLTHRTLDQIAADEGSAEWESNRPAAKKSRKKDWLGEAVAKHNKALNAEEVGVAEEAARTKRRTAKKKSAPAKNDGARAHSTSGQGKSPFKNSSVFCVSPVVGVALDLSEVPGARKASMPTAIRPMLATLVDEPFTAADWLYEIKWDGYRAVAFIENGAVRFVSRNQNDLTAQYPELGELPERVRARTAIVDGEIVALDEEGRASFSLMQQRTGIGHAGRRVGPALAAPLRGSAEHGEPGVGRANNDVPIVYYAFDLLYLDGYDLRRVDLEERKKLLSHVLAPDSLVRYSDDFPDGNALYEAAKQRGLEGIIAKRRKSCYIEKRSRDWLKTKITHRQECVIGGYTDPKGSREHFGSIVLGLYNDKGRLIHVGQAGSGFTQTTHEGMWQGLNKLQTDKSPFYGKVEALRKVHWVKPELVAEIKFTEWTHETQDGGVKMRAPVYEGLRLDKAPRECVFEKPRESRVEVAKAEQGKAA
jgi:bifunctional non-homologous end joining protein LigD